MSRIVPWRNKPTPFLLQMIQEVKNYKLYLVNQLGPTSFVFKDDHDNKFKVTIGMKLSCSCGIVQNDHCIHTLFVLMKKYKVDESNPILWQASYLDSELEGMMHLKYSAKKKSQPTHKYLRRAVESIKQQSIKQQPDDDDFPPVNDDDSCPICYEELKGQCYSQCSQCRNCIHTNCLKVWTRHKQDTASAVTCPMCRSEFQNPTLLIMKDTEKWNNRFMIHRRTKCAGCNTKNIKGILFHCLTCQQTNLYRLCFEDGQHPNHSNFFMKPTASSNWILAPQRETQQNRLPIYKNIHQRSEDTIEKALEKAYLPPDPTQFIVSLFPTLRNLQSKALLNMGDLGIIGNQLKTKTICNKCRLIGSDDMRKLNCGHTIHEACLREMISKGDYECEIDGQIIAKGYLSAMGIKPVKRVKKPMVDLQMNKRTGELKSLLEMGNYDKTTLIGQTFQSASTLQSAIQQKKNGPHKGQKTSFTIRSNSIRRNVAERRQQDFVLVGNANTFIMATVNNVLPPKSRSVIRPHF